MINFLWWGHELLKTELSFVVDSDVKSVTLVVESEVKVVLGFEELDKLFTSVEVKSQKSTVFEVKVLGVKGL